VMHTNRNTANNKNLVFIIVCSLENYVCNDTKKRGYCDNHLLSF
jgi:hypothetical protein